MAYKGYYLKIGDCTFQSPAIKREGLIVNPRIVQVTDNKVLASGKLSIKKLEHRPMALNVTFPIMTPAQWQVYAKYLRGEMTGEDEMALTVEYFDEERDGYFTGTFYHYDLKYTPTVYNGQRMLLVDPIDLIEL